MRRSRVHPGSARPATDTDKNGKVPGRADDERENREHIDKTAEPPTDAGHSDADTQTQRNIEDESPA